MKAILLGKKEEWHTAVNLLLKYRNDIVIYGLCDGNIETKMAEPVVYTLAEAIDLYQKREIDTIINFDASLPFWSEYLNKNGVEVTYAIPSHYYQKDILDAAEIQNMLVPYGSIEPELHNLEFQLADGCNLKCKGCTHFSNLVKEPVYADFEQFKKDLQQLSSLFKNIREFYMLGGEPLLNPQVEQYLYAAKKYFPYTQIQLVTNGILVMKMSESLLQTVVDTGTMLSISNYDCLDEQKIEDFLLQKEVNYNLRNGKECFTKFLNSSGNSDIHEVFRDCPRKNCTYLDKGKIAACTQPFTIKYFNEYFGEEFSTLGAIDIYEAGITGYQILAQLLRPMDACRYCTHDEVFEWGISKAVVDKNDWCVK